MTPNQEAILTKLAVVRLHAPYEWRDAREFRSRELLHPLGALFRMRRRGWVQSAKVGPYRTSLVWAITDAGTEALRKERGDTTDESGNA
jgi:hypothetical protein